MTVRAGLRAGGIGGLLLLTALLAGACAQPAGMRDPGPGRAVGLYQGLSPGDRHLARATVQLALEKRLSGSPATWVNSANGNTGTVTPLRTYRTSRSFFCRDYREAVQSRTRGSVERQRTACRDRDGVWKVPSLR